MFFINHGAVDVISGLCFNRRVETDAYIALGSNLGDRELNLLRAAGEIGKLPAGRITGLSPFYETSPVGVSDQPLFYNAVLRLSTGLSAHDLLNGSSRSRARFLPGRGPFAGGRARWILIFCSSVTR